jgi:hypothetical protein
LAAFGEGFDITKFTMFKTKKRKEKGREVGFIILGKEDLRN